MVITINLIKSASHGNEFAVEQLLEMYGHILYETEIENVNMGMVTILFIESMEKVIENYTKFDIEQLNEIIFKYELEREVKKSISRAKSTPVKYEESFETVLIDNMWVDCAIKRIPPDLREVIYLYYYEQLTPHEIGKVMNISDLRFRIYHGTALMMLRKELNKI